MQEWCVSRHSASSDSGRPADRAAALDVHVEPNQKIPLNIDESLVSEGTGTALDPASLMGERFVIDKNVPLSGNSRSRSNPRERRRCDPPGRFERASHRQAAGQRSAARDGRHRDPQSRIGRGDLRRLSSRRLGTETRTIADDKPATNIAPAARGLSTASRSTPRRRPTRTSIRSPRSPTTPTMTAKMTSTASPPTDSRRTSATTRTASSRIPSNTHRSTTTTKTAK